jgi:hypothetical protein
MLDRPVNHVDALGLVPGREQAQPCALRQLATQTKPFPKKQRRQRRNTWFLCFVAWKIELQYVSLRLLKIQKKKTIRSITAHDFSMGAIEPSTLEMRALATVPVHLKPHPHFVLGPPAASL